MTHDIIIIITAMTKHQNTMKKKGQVKYVKLLWYYYACSSFQFSL